MEVSNRGLNPVWERTRKGKARPSPKREPRDRVSMPTIAFDGAEAVGAPSPINVGGAPVPCEPLTSLATSIVDCVHIDADDHGLTRGLMSCYFRYNKN